MTIQAIYDKDHGLANCGWYARVNDGQERDIPFDGRESLRDFSVRTRAIAAARDDGYSVPRGMAVDIHR